MAFVSAMIKDSISLGHRIGFYTSMVGKKKSLKPLIKLLKELKVPHVFSTDFVQGDTTRWGIAWSFSLPSNPSFIHNHLIILPETSSTKHHRTKEQWKVFIDESK